MSGLGLGKVDLRSIWGHQYWEVAVELTKNYAVNKSLEKKATLRYVRSFASKQNHNHGCFAKPDQFNNTIHSGSIRNQWQPYWKNLSKICHQTLQFSSIILCIRSCICSTSGMYIKYGFLDIFKNHWFFFSDSNVDKQKFSWWRFLFDILHNIFWSRRRSWTFSRS